ncbi:MAG: S1C family serine protease [Acidimicrobiales bacterium]
MSSEHHPGSTDERPAGPEPSDPFAAEVAPAETRTEPLLPPPPPGPAHHERTEATSPPPAPPVSAWPPASIGTVPPGPPSSSSSPSPDAAAVAHRTPRWVIPLVVLAALTLVAGGALAGWAVADRSDSAATAPTVPATLAPSDGGQGGLVATNVEEPVAEVARAVAPSVVQINTDFGLGSGVVMDTDGHILTAAHVISGAQQIQVRLADGTMVPARIVGTNPDTDVGVVAIDARSDLVPAVLGVDADIQVGQLAVAVGSPFGLEQTVTSGIVSALDRPVQTEGSMLVGMIQTDASINPGNSGGALADRHGRVIGINDAIRTQGGGNEGVGFAIPIDLAASIAERLIAGEEIRSGFLGVSANNPMEGRPGALVQEVTPGTPAADAGIEVGDLIVAIDGEPVRGIQDLRARILARPAGSEVTVEVDRDGDTVEFEVVLATSSG